VEVVEVRGSNLSATLLAQLRERSVVPDSDQTYTIATTAFVANELTEKLGRIATRLPGALSRDLTVSYLRSHGFRSFSASSSSNSNLKLDESCISKPKSEISNRTVHFLCRLLLRRLKSSGRPI
jgi:hypothetical protein